MVLNDNYVKRKVNFVEEEEKLLSHVLNRQLCTY